MYKLLENDGVLRVVDMVSFTNNPANTDYQQYLQWLAEGNTPEPYVAPPAPIPQSVTRFQALAVLSAGGHLPAIRTYINTLDQDDIVRLAWENAAEWERSSPTLNALATMLGLTSEQVDDLFVAASQVSA